MHEQMFLTTSLTNTAGTAQRFAREAHRHRVRRRSSPVQPYSLRVFSATSQVFRSIEPEFLSTFHCEDLIFLNTLLSSVC